MKEYKFAIDGEQFTVIINSVKESCAEVSVNGISYKVEIEKEKNEPLVVKAVSATKKVSDGTKVTSPLPGVIIEISVTENQFVKAGEKVAVLEAMKMENEITAPKDGVVSAISVKKGDSVLEGDTIMIL